ncbi:Penicillin-binding protein A [Clostridium liquoris]|jgi:cell division protein FtsI/penicillin-binding protein 2|uniref:Penicillin-binding protein A n=1 Tax=Clostridium liquoris TaxID=1289519 RepID=A0A2T0B9N8_9CLOT|nr:penicillin-binding transpeptidase domain-containing protein [Clostridium liquoris]PRR80600.1 Penicillin-binding protein A [Clostridium liquoris]
MKDISDNIKKVMIIFLLCFIGLISYITYFEFIVAPKIVSSQYNQRLWDKRNEVLRGTIYDRNMKALAKSTRIDKGSQKRQYVEGPAFAHALGYLDVKYGITGLEKKYDKELISTNVKDTLADFIKSKGKNGEKCGNNLKTTLDYNLQKKAYELLGDNRGAVVALNPKTGEILAMVSKPSFDPNYLNENWKNINENKERPLLNRATSGLYPPGSTFKTITAVSALENVSGIMDKRINDTGVLEFNSKESLKNYNGEALGDIGFEEAFIHSSNVYFGNLGIEIGNPKLKETAEKFYFNKNIPADGVTIENSRFPTLKSYEKGNIAQSAIGQGTVLTTPMEMALVASTIANDGIMMKPCLVKEVQSSKGEVLQTIKPEPIQQVTTNGNAKIIKDFMRKVVEEGTGTAAAVENINVCGKTGTADHSDEGSGALPHSWFIGFAPYEDPQIALAVIIEDGGQGGIAAANVASGIFRTALIK